MKTTIEIADELLARSRKLADRQGITLRALVEEGLRLALESHSKGVKHGFELPTFGSGGLTPRYEESGLHRAILDSYAAVAPESPATSHWPTVQDRDRR